MCPGERLMHVDAGPPAPVFQSPSNWSPGAGGGLAGQLVHQAKRLGEPPWQRGHADLGAERGLDVPPQPGVPQRQVAPGRDQGDGRARLGQGERLAAGEGGPQVAPCSASRYTSASRVRRYDRVARPLSGSSQPPWENWLTLSSAHPSAIAPTSRSAGSPRPPSPPPAPPSCPPPPPPAPPPP